MNENDISQAEPLGPPEEAISPPPPEPAKKAAPPKGRSLLARALRWLLVALILFGLGALLILFTLYIPTRDALENQRRNIQQITDQSEAELERANQEIDRLSDLVEQNNALQEELDQANLRVTLLQARADVLTAQLALVEGDGDKALLALSTTAETLEKLASQLPAENRDFITTLQKRLDLTREGIQNDDSAAESDLDVLIIKLLELEEALLR
jgi:TolA-binding protein